MLFQGDSDYFGLLPQRLSLTEENKGLLNGWNGSAYTWGDDTPMAALGQGLATCPAGKGDDTVTPASEAAASHDSTQRPLQDRVCKATLDLHHSQVTETCHLPGETVRCFLKKKSKLTVHCLWRGEENSSNKDDPTLCLLGKCNSQLIPRSKTEAATGSGPGLGP